MQPDRMKQLFKPDSVALFGASTVEGALGTVLLQNLKSAGFHGEITLVNPKYEEIDGETCFPSLAACGREVDLASTVLGAAVFAAPLLTLHLVSPASMGFGDVKTALVLGAASGAIDWRLALAALALATAVAGIVAGAESVAFGPGLVAAAAISLAACTTFVSLPAHDAAPADPTAPPVLQEAAP